VLTVVLINCDELFFTERVRVKTEFKVHFNLPVLIGIVEDYVFVGEWSVIVVLILLCNLVRPPAVESKHRG
jgi:hypothetical protein